MLIIVKTFLHSPAGGSLPTRDGVCCMPESKQVLVLNSRIEKTDKEIDRTVYQLYGLTEDEIRIV